jgi:hypothetical protein
MAEAVATFLAGVPSPHTVGKSCLYVKRLSDVDRSVLTSVVTAAYRTRTGKILRS